ncbi:MAG TPA: hypothetical protein VI055_04810, partial [Rubrobacter sp.]
SLFAEHQCRPKRSFPAGLRPQSAPYQHTASVIRYYIVRYCVVADRVCEEARSRRYDHPPGGVGPGAQRDL